MQYYTIISGIGFHYTKLGSFDQALLDADVGNYNLVKVSSILPAGCEERTPIELRHGSILYTAYTSLSAEYGSIFSSAIAIGIPEHSTDIGVIMEYSGFIDINNAKNLVVNMVDDAMRVRGIPLKSIVNKEVDSKLIKPGQVNCGFISTFVGVALWNDNRIIGSNI
jgi:arginine decarboxylase